MLGGEGAQVSASQSLCCGPVATRELRASHRSIIGALPRERPDGSVRANFALEIRKRKKKKGKKKKERCTKPMRQKENMLIFSLDPYRKETVQPCRLCLPYPLLSLVVSEPFGQFLPNLTEGKRSREILNFYKFH